MGSQRSAQEARAGGADQPHVLVVDDDDRLRELLRRYLADHGFLVATARDAEDARARMRTLAFDVIVLDVMMPGEDGFAYTRALRRHDDIPVLMLTALDEVDDRITGLDSGADDYLVKPFEPRELLARLNAVLRRAHAPAAGLVRFGDFEFDLGIGELRHGAQAVALTSAEAGLLRALAERPGAVVSRERLSDTTRVGARSVDVQINRLRRKIEPDPRAPRYLVTVRGEGYSLRAG
jgi:two-component system phosphate regulon response regulator OmpR